MNLLHDWKADLAVVALVILTGLVGTGMISHDTATALLAALAAIGIKANAAATSGKADALPPVNPPGSSFADRVRGQSGRSVIHPLVALAVAFMVAGCMSPIPKTHVEADIARYSAIGKEWSRYIHTGYGPDGRTLTASYIAACDADIYAWRRENLESGKTAGMLPADATSTAAIGGD